MSRTIEIEHNGETLHGVVMRIKSTSLTIEDHGIVTAYLHCEGDGSGIGVGGYCLDQPVKDADGKFLRREGTGYGLDHIMQILNTAGVGSWEKLPGLNIIVLHETPSVWGSTAVGFAHISDEKKVLIFKDHAEAWEEKS